MVDWLVTYIDWLIDNVQTDWLTECFVAEWWSEWPTYWLADLYVQTDWPSFVAEWRSEWPTYWLARWIIFYAAWVGEWTDLISNSQADVFSLMANWQTVRSDRLTNWLTELFTDRQTDIPTSFYSTPADWRTVDWQINWLTEWLTDWRTDRQTYRST